MNKTFLLSSDSIRKRVGIWLQSLQLDPAHPLEVVVRDHELAKTPAQRKLFHAICRDIGRELGHSPAEVKHAIKVDWFGIHTYQIGQKTYTSVYSSEEPGKREYSELIEYALQWGAERGVYVKLDSGGRVTQITFELHGKMWISTPPAQQIITVLSATCEGITVQLTGGRMAYTLPDDKKVQLKISYQDANGNPAKIDGAVVWTSSDVTIATTAPTTPPAADNSTVWLTPGTAGGAIGQAQITAKADADLGTGVTELVTVLDVEVVGGQAVAGTIEPVGALEPLA